MTEVADGAGGVADTGAGMGAGAGDPELVRICDSAGLTRGSGFVADDRGTVVTSHEAVDGLTRVVLHGPGPAGRVWVARPQDVTVLPDLALALVRTDGLGVRPLPVAARGVLAPGTYVRLLARGWRQARVLGGVEVSYLAADGRRYVLTAGPSGGAGAARPEGVSGRAGDPGRAGPAVELAIGTDGRDALRLGGDACGGPVLDPATGAVLAVVSTALRAEHRSGCFAVALRAAAAADPGGPLAALLARNATTVPAYGPDLNLAGALELAGTTLAAAGLPDPAALVDRPGVAAELAAFTAGNHPVLAVVGTPGTGRTTALAALTVRRAAGEPPAPTLWLRGADLRAGDASLADAVARALDAAADAVAAAVPAPDSAARPVSAARATSPACAAPVPLAAFGAGVERLAAEGLLADPEGDRAPVQRGDGRPAGPYGAAGSAGSAGRDLVGAAGAASAYAYAVPLVVRGAGDRSPGARWDAAAIPAPVEYGPGDRVPPAPDGAGHSAAGAGGEGTGAGARTAAVAVAGAGVRAGAVDGDGAEAGTGARLGAGDGVGGGDRAGAAETAGTGAWAVARGGDGAGVRDVGGAALWAGAGAGEAAGAGAWAASEAGAGWRGGSVAAPGPVARLGSGSGPGAAPGAGETAGAGVWAGGGVGGVGEGPGDVAGAGPRTGVGDDGGVGVGEVAAAGAAGWAGAGTWAGPGAGAGGARGTASAWAGAGAGAAAGAFDGDTCHGGVLAGARAVAPVGPGTDGATGVGGAAGAGAWDGRRSEVVPGFGPATRSGPGPEGTAGVGEAAGAGVGEVAGAGAWDGSCNGAVVGAGLAGGADGRRGRGDAGAGGVDGGGPGSRGRDLVRAVVEVVARAGREVVVVLDAPEEMPPELARRLGPWTDATVGWLRGSGVRLVLAARPEYWERAGALYPPGALHTPARPARRLPPALPVGDLAPAEAARLRTRLGIPAGAVREADARHPLTLRLLAGIRAAGVTAGCPGRDEVFAAHLDLLCLRAALRIAAARATTAPETPAPTTGAAVHGPGVGRLAARVAGRVHEAARRCLGPGRGSLPRDSFEELFPRRTGWAEAVLAEGLLVPAGTGYRFAHEELSDWLQAAHLDVPTALTRLVHGPAAPGLPVPRHRIGPVLEALRRLPPDDLGRELTGLVRRLHQLAEDADAGPDRVWWAARLLRETLLRAPDAHAHLPVLHALAEHVARAGPGGFDGRFWNRLRLPEPDRLDLLRRLLPADPADALPGDRCLDAAARRLARDPQRAQPLLCAWFDDERRLRGRPGATVATAAQALLYAHRRLAVDDLAEALVTAAHPRADELLAVLAEEEPSALSRAVHRWAHDERPGRRVAAAAYGLATAPHVRIPADRELLRGAARALLARPADAPLHGSALAVLLRDPHARGHCLPDALACFADPGRGSRLPAEALVAALPVLPDPDAVFAALRARADGEVLRALAALTTPGLARRAADLVREHLARCPEDAPHAAAFVDRRLEHGPAAEPVLRPLVLDLLRTAPVAVRAELAAVLAAPGGEPPQVLRGELAAVLLREETDPQVLDAFLGGVAAGVGGRPEIRTRELLRRTGRQLLRAPGGPAVFERRTVELARSDPAFGVLVAGWLAQAQAEAAALLGPSARRTVEMLGRAAADGT